MPRTWTIRLSRVAARMIIPRSLFFRKSHREMRMARVNTMMNSR